MESLVSRYSGEPLIREQTVALLSGIANNDIKSQIGIITQWVKDHVTYIRDPENAEYLVSPIRMISNYLSFGFMAGDCDDHVVLLNTMLGSIGIQTKCVGVKFGRSDEFNHVISGVNYNGQMVLIDPCAKGSVQPTYYDKLIV